MTIISSVLLICLFVEFYIIRPYVKYVRFNHLRPLPPIELSDVFVVKSKADMVALSTATIGDMCWVEGIEYLKIADTSSHIDWMML